MSTQRYKQYHFKEFNEQERYRADQHRSRSRSGPKRYHRRDTRSRSRSHSVERRRRRNRSFSRSRSRSRDYQRNQRKYNPRYIKSSRCKSRSHSRSRTQNHGHSRSRSRTPTSVTCEHRRFRSSNNVNHSDIKNGYKVNNRNAHLPKCLHDETSASVPSFVMMHTNLEDLPLPQHETVGAYYNLDTDQPIDKARIHREIEEKLRQTLAKEGKVYPPPKPEASHPVFANDGSFLEIFKKMQEAQQQQLQPSVTTVTVAPNVVVTTASTSTATYVSASSIGKSGPPPPIVGRRRGGKILKTGVVLKPKAQAETNADPKDFWSLYLAEVNKYKNTACESESGNRPLVK